jgi:hypothetical protein
MRRKEPLFQFERLREMTSTCLYLPSALEGQSQLSVCAKRVIRNKVRERLVDSYLLVEASLAKIRVRVHSCTAEIPQTELSTLRDHSPEKSRSLGDANQGEMVVEGVYHCVTCSLSSIRCNLRHFVVFLTTQQYRRSMRPRRAFRLTNTR